MNFPAFSPKTRRRWNLSTDHSAPIPLPQHPPTPLEPHEIADLMTVFRTFQSPSPATLRPRARTLQSLLVLPQPPPGHDGTSPLNPDDIHVLQLAFLLQDQDLDARRLLETLQNTPQHAHADAWKNAPNTVGDTPAYPPPSSFQAVSWLSYAAHRHRVGAAHVATLADPDAAIAHAFAAALVGALRALAEGSTEDPDHEATYRVLRQFSPLLLWGESASVVRDLLASVEDGWSPREALVALRDLPPGPPLLPSFYALHQSLATSVPLPLEDARRELLALARAIDARYQDTPRLLDMRVIDDDGAIWSWLDLMAAAAMPDLVARIVALLDDGDDDWLDFDAPGEGTWPLHLYRALRLAGHDHPSACAILGPLLANSPERDDWLEEQDHPLDTWLAAYPEPLMTIGDEDRAKPEERGLMHEGIDEAFGDVFSPHDPFSVRDDE